jgi:hypothetical protein
MQISKNIIPRLVLIHYIVLLAVTSLHHHDHYYYSAGQEFFNTADKSKDAIDPFSDGKSGCLLIHFANTGFYNQDTFHNNADIKFLATIFLLHAEERISKLISLPQLRAPPVIS